MKYLNKISYSLMLASVGMMGLASCESDELYTIDSPDWLASRVDSIAATQVSEELEGQIEDVYSFGKTDYSSGWWAAFSKYYVVPDGKMWQAQFNLNINPNDNTYYKNFALVVANAERDATGYAEYGAFRFDLTDNASAFNSNWGTVFGVIENEKDFKYTDSSVKFSPVDNKDEGLQKMAGKVTVTIDRTDPNRYYMELTNGTITKTFDMPSNIDEGKDIYAFLVPEGSYIDFLSTNIEPIGGCTSKEDKKPLSLTLSGLAGEVLVGTPLDSVVASVTGVVEFEQMLSKNVTSADLQFQVIPDMDELGEKTLVAIYNKTFKGENCDSVVVATKTFKVVKELSSYTETVVVPANAVLGATDCSMVFFSTLTENFKVAPKETKVLKFINHTDGAANWNNFFIVVNTEALKEYAVFRADNFGWGDNYSTCTADCGTRDDAGWAKWLADMNGAKVTVYVTNNGNGTADVRYDITATDTTYYQTYTGLKVDADDMYFRMGGEKFYAEFEKELGTSDCKTAWWTQFTQNVKVVPNQVCTVNFTNYTSGGGNWNNWVLILNDKNLKEYAVLRADNWGWGNGWDACQKIGGQADDAAWAVWRGAMNGAKVTLTIANNGNGTVDIKATAIGSDGNTYVQEYRGVNNVDAENLYFRFTVDSSYLVFE